MWADKSLHLSHSFKQLVATHYKATLASVDFKNKGDQVCHEVNSWVERKTNGLITELFPSKAVTDLTSLVYANSLCFKGVWKHKFDASCTSEYNFHLLNGTSVKVPFMSNEKETHFIRTFDGFKVLHLSYKQGRDRKRRFSMCIFLPDAKDGLLALIEKLASESGFLKGKLPRRKVRVGKFTIPKFKISFTLEACNVLKELGVVSPFSNSDADFTKIVDSPMERVYVESMFHKASIEVDEEGTEATAGDSMFGTLLCMTTGIDFVADHPFLFLIRENLTGTILFVWQVLNPLDGAATSVKKEDMRTKYKKMLRRLMGDLEVSEEEDEGDDDIVDKLEVPPKRKRSRKDY